MWQIVYICVCMFVGSSIFVADFMVHKSGALRSKNMLFLFCLVGFPVCVVVPSRRIISFIVTSSSAFFSWCLFCILLMWYSLFSWRYSFTYFIASIGRREMFIAIPSFGCYIRCLMGAFFLQITLQWHIEPLPLCLSHRFSVAFFLFVGNNKVLIEA